MKKALLSIILMLALLLSTSPMTQSVYATDTGPETEQIKASILDACVTNTSVVSEASPTEMPYPITRLGYSIFIDCPFTLLSLDAEGEWQEADYIEPEFEIPPENVLWLIEPDQSYRMQVNLSSRIPNIDPGHLPSDADYAFNVIYTGDVDEGGLGTLRIEFAEHIGDVFMIYRSELKFVADNGANLFCTPTLALDEKGILTVEFRPRAEGETYTHQFEVETTFAGPVKAYAIQDWTKATVYSADLSHYLYPYGIPEELKTYFEETPTLNPDTQPYRVAVG